jgi:protein O-GlcNAc transferase
MATEYHDYIIADKIVIPEKSKKYYSEKVAYLPHCFQPNDRKRAFPTKEFTRAELGLPEKAFIFCCFNNPYKINPKIFTLWMKILQETEESVLWLKINNQEAMNNLKTQIIKNGIDPHRIIFAQHSASYEDYLAQYKLADLFLDTTPFNAHTTASESLWMGLPVLTVQGETYISRVSSSLLLSVGLDELITSNLDRYCAKAINLAKNKLTTPLFNTPLYTKNLESLYFKMYDKYKHNLKNDDIELHS